MTTMTITDSDLRRAAQVAAATLATVRAASAMADHVITPEFRAAAARAVALGRECRAALDAADRPLLSDFDMTVLRELPRRNRKGC